MKNTLLLVAITLMTLILWVGISASVKTVDEENKKSIEMPILVNDRIDIEYIKLIQ